ncbi:hypothetical protein Dimus_037239 [Dionaea muscipula]
MGASSTAMAGCDDGDDGGCIVDWRGRSRRWCSSWPVVIDGGIGETHSDDGRQWLVAVVEDSLVVASSPSPSMDDGGHGKRGQRRDHGRRGQRRWVHHRRRWLGATTATAVGASSTVVVGSRRWLGAPRSATRRWWRR